MLSPGPVAVFDFDDSLPRLRRSLEGQQIVTVPTDGGFAEFRARLQSDGWHGIKTIVVDTLTRVEELAVAHTLKTVPISTEMGISS